MDLRSPPGGGRLEQDLTEPRRNQPESGSDAAVPQVAGLHDRSERQAV